jgi:hypothetical protein
MKIVNKTGYLKGAKTAKNPVNIIPSNLITTQGMAFPIKANGKTLYPNTGQYKFDTPYVVETPLKQDGSEELKASEAAKFTYRIKDKKRRDTQVADMYNNTLDSFRGDTTGAKRHFKSFFTHYGSERFDGVRPLEGYYGFDRKDYNDKTLDSLGRNWHKQMRASKKQDGTKSAKAEKESPVISWIKDRIIDRVKPTTYDILPRIGEFIAGEKYNAKEKITPERDSEDFKVGLAADQDVLALSLDRKPRNNAVVKQTSSKPISDKSKKNNYYSIPSLNKESVVRNYAEGKERMAKLNKKYPGKIEYNLFEKGLDYLPNPYARLIPSYKNKKDLEEYRKKGVIYQNDKGMYNNDESFSPMGNFGTWEGKDEKGRYISYKDKIDYQGSLLGKVIKPILKQKDVNIYDRIYIDKEGNPIIDEDLRKDNSKERNKKKQGSKDMKPLIKYQQGVLSISAKNKKQFQDVANNKKQTVKKGFFEPFVFGQKPGSIGEKIGQVLTLGNKSYPGQGYSITPSEVTKQTAIDLAAGKVLGLAAKTPAAKKVGEYITTKTPLKNLYKLNPFSVKENPNVLLHRVQKPGQTEEYIMEQFNKPNPRELLKSNEPGWGRAFSSDPSDMYYYTNPRVMQTRGYSGNPEILRTVMPKKDIAKFDIEAYNASRSSEGLPLYGSSKPKSEFILPIEDVINAKKFGIDDLDKLVKESHKFNTPHWLKGFKKQGSKNVKSVLKYKNGSKSVSLAFSRGEKDPKGGLTQKGVDKYNRATGGNLKMAVTTPPSKLKPGSKAANRRKSFCSRMKGMKSKLTSAKTANNPNSRINKSLRKWNCN